MVAAEAGAGAGESPKDKEGAEIPGEVALLPLEEKAKHIVRLRRQGKTYREIMKLLKVSPRDIRRTLKAELRRDEIEELKGRLSNVERAIADLKGFMAELSEIKSWLEVGLRWRFRKDSMRCVHNVEGFCEGWVWKEPVKEWSMKKTEEGYFLNVDRHRWACALCPMFTPIWLDQIIREVDEARR